MVMRWPWTLGIAWLVLFCSTTIYATPPRLAKSLPSLSALPPGSSVLQRYLQQLVVAQNETIAYQACLKLLQQQGAMHALVDAFFESEWIETPRIASCLGTLLPRPLPLLRKNIVDHSTREAPSFRGLLLLKAWAPSSRMVRRELAVLASYKTPKGYTSKAEQVASLYRDWNLRRVAFHLLLRLGPQAIPDVSFVAMHGARRERREAFLQLARWSQQNKVAETVQNALVQEGLKRCYQSRFKRCLGVLLFLHHTQRRSLPWLLAQWKRARVRWLLSVWGPRFLEREVRGIYSLGDRYQEQLRTTASNNKRSEEQRIDAILMLGHLLAVDRRSLETLSRLVVTSSSRSVASVGLRVLAGMGPPAEPFLLHVFSKLNDYRKGYLAETASEWNNISPRMLEQWLRYLKQHPTMLDIGKVWLVSALGPLVRASPPTVSLFRREMNPQSSETLRIYALEGLIHMLPLSSPVLWSVLEQALRDPKLRARYGLAKLLQKHPQHPYTLRFLRRVFHKHGPLTREMLRVVNPKHPTHKKVLLLLLPDIIKLLRHPYAYSRWAAVSVLERMGTGIWPQLIAATKTPDWLLYANLLVVMGRHPCVRTPKVRCPAALHTVLARAIHHKHPMVRCRAFTTLRYPSEFATLRNVLFKRWFPNRSRKEQRKALYLFLKKHCLYR
ncbi:MAG: hypothetical protein EP343_03590 [Deltaproteobacteria bacterium]|nr:MAG: hypothetical protein EP343_03590 [Deltaproteobacteria bacterium]